MVKDVLPELNIGLIGHVDHGKTTLTQALSGKWTDTHSESLKRGITIKLGYADIALRKCPKCTGFKAFTSNEKCGCKSKTKILRRISLVDAPGHETLMAVMISGAAIMDGALLLVAANEPCPQPQTQEHLAALKILGLKNILVIQNKIDLVTKDAAKKNYQQIKAFVKEALGFEVPIIPVSAQKRINLDYLVEAMQELFKIPKRDEKAAPELLVARSFDINKPGKPVKDLVGGVIGGSITHGVFKVNDTIELRPGVSKKTKTGTEWVPVKTKVTSIVSGSIFVKRKGPGGSIALSTNLDPYTTKGDSLVGNVAGKPGKLPPIWSNMELEVTLFDNVLGIKDKIKIESLKSNEPLMLSVGTSTTLGITTQIGKKAKFMLKRPICASKGQKVALSRQIKNRWHLIGFGVIV